MNSAKYYLTRAYLVWLQSVTILLNANMIKRNHLTNEKETANFGEYVLIKRENIFTAC